MVTNKLVIIPYLLSVIFIFGCKNEREEVTVRNDTLTEVPSEDVSKIQRLRPGEYKVSVLKGDDSPIFDADLKITDIRKGEQQYNKVSGTYSIKEVYGTFKPRFPENGTFLADLDTMRSSMIIPGRTADAKDVIVTFSDREEFIGGEWRIDTEADVNYTGKFKANYLIKDQN